MTPTQQLLLRNALLLQLEAANPATLPCDTLEQGLRLAAHPHEHLQSELAYLADKGLLSTHPHPLSPTRTRYRITAAGRDYLQAEGLA